MCMSGEGGGEGGEARQKKTACLLVCCVCERKRDSERAQERENKHARGREGGRAVSEKAKDSVSVLIYLRVSVQHVFLFRMCCSFHTHCVCVDKFFFWEVC